MILACGEGRLLANRWLARGVFSLNCQALDRFEDAVKIPLVAHVHAVWPSHKLENR
jgi:hypothetical protein